MMTRALVIWSVSAAVLATLLGVLDVPLLGYRGWAAVTAVLWATMFAGRRWLK